MHNRPIGGGRDGVDDQIETACRVRDERHTLAVGREREAAPVCRRGPRVVWRATLYRDGVEAAAPRKEEGLPIPAPETAATALPVGIARQSDGWTASIRWSDPHVVDPSVVIGEPDVPAVGRPLVPRGMLDLNELIDRQLRWFRRGSRRGCL